MSKIKKRKARFFKQIFNFITECRHLKLQIVFHTDIEETGMKNPAPQKHLVIIIITANNLPNLKPKIFTIFRNGSQHFALNLKTNFCILFCTRSGIMLPLFYL